MTCNNSTMKLVIVTSSLLFLSACGSDDTPAEVKEVIEQVDSANDEVTQAESQPETEQTSVPVVSQPIVTEQTETVEANNPEVTTSTAEGDMQTSAEEPTAVIPEEAIPEEVTEEVTTYTGKFLDSAVSGLNYQTQSQSGSTNDEGEYIFQADENITFSIGNIELPTIAARLYLTPLSVFQSQNINQLEVVNLLRLLQTLDMDGDTSNGITIPEASHDLATSNIDFSAADFDSQVDNLVMNSGALLTSLISADDAIAHFQTTLTTIENDDLSSCISTNEKVGHSGFFSTLAHDVSGKATIIDDCTIEISEFTYDGDGPAVYLYGAVDHAYESNDAFAIGSLLTRDVEYNNESFQITLPQGKSLDDFTGLSVWCVDFAVSFGQMEFTP